MLQRSSHGIQACSLVLLTGHKNKLHHGAALLQCSNTRDNSNHVSGNVVCDEMGKIHFCMCLETRPGSQGSCVVQNNKADKTKLEQSMGLTYEYIIVKRCMNFSVVQRGLKTSLQMFHYWCLQIRINMSLLL